MNFAEKFEAGLPLSVLDTIKSAIEVNKKAYDERDTDYDSDYVADVEDDFGARQIQRLRKLRRGSAEWKARADDSLMWPPERWYEHFTGETRAGQLPETFYDRIYESTEDAVHKYFDTYRVDSEGCELLTPDEVGEVQMLIEQTLRDELGGGLPGESDE